MLDTPTNKRTITPMLALAGVLTRGLMMATPIDAPYKAIQRALESEISMPSFAYRRYSGRYGRTPLKPAIAVRDGKLNKKFGRRLATSYRSKGLAS